MTIATVGVVGLGNMGLGMAATLARKGFAVLGYDIDAGRRLPEGAARLLGWLADHMVAFRPPPA